jgi:hypothetical protein
LESRPAPAADRPLELVLEPAAVRSRFAEPDPSDPLRAAVARRGGLSSGIAALARARQPHAGAPLVLALGPAVARSLPTAARLSILAVLPGSPPRISDAQVGSAFARSLAGIAHTLEIHGQARGRNVLVIEEAPASAEPTVRLEPAPFDARFPLPARCALLARRHQTAAVLACGPAAEEGLAFATLGAGVEPTSYTGREGLGLALFQRGLVAIVVRMPRRTPPPPPREWLALLERSPRLLERAREGTLESAVPHSLESQAAPPPFELEALRSTKHGCAGCPTPCGWVFQRSRQGLHHSALAPLHAHDPAAAQATLERLNELGIDAKSFAALLELHPDLAPDALLARTDLHGPPPQPAPRRLLARLAQASALRRSDPLRTSPFLLHDAPDSSRLRAALHPLNLSTLGADPEHPEHKGRILYWHENLLAALDTCGFCAFSAAGLLTDGILTLEELGARLEFPDMLEAGAQALLLLAELQGIAPSGLDPEYAALRGLGPDGRVEAWAREAAEKGRLVRTAMERLLALEAQSGIAAARQHAGGEGAGSQSAGNGRAAGRFTFVLHGTLAQHFGPERVVECELPCRLDEALERLLALGGERAGAREWLLQASAWRAGKKLERGAWVREGERVDLVVALSGG